MAEFADDPIIVMAGSSIRVTSIYMEYDVLMLACEDGIERTYSPDMNLRLHVAGDVPEPQEGKFNLLTDPVEVYIREEEESL